MIRQKIPLLILLMMKFFSAIKRRKAEIEKGTLGIYILATVSFLSFVIFLLIDPEPFDWINFVINIALIAIYYCLAIYSNYKPFTAFVTTLCIVVVTLLVGIIFSSQPGVKGILIKFIFIVYIATHIEAAKKVQDYESTQVE